ncbi:Arm DNA-binding domain-containing protein [Enterocloster clostridioformis]|uniref:Arm DNA-binding domain-containing protein n=1 Tax=Enterocloster clostridioformis TaxID=1531 RepID=UPI000942FDFD|nr:Arm DNA-binding domain-containing protein [Enterocloster clostridioformis]
MFIICWTTAKEKKGFAARKEAVQHEAEMKTKLQNPGQIASITSQRKQTVARGVEPCEEIPLY